MSTPDGMRTGDDQAENDRSSKQEPCAREHDVLVAVVETFTKLERAQRWIARRIA